MTTQRDPLSARWLDTACLFSMLALSIARSGIGLYVFNQTFQVPLVESIRDPSAFPGDLFVRTLAHYASPFWWAVARLPIPVRVLLIGGLVVARLFMLYSAGRLASAVAPSARLARPIAWAFFALAPSPAIGAGTMVPGYFEHTSVALACIMMASAFVFERRTAAAGLLLGLAFACNFLYAAFAATFLGALLLVRKDIPHRWRIALALPLALPVLAMAAHASADRARDASLWIRALLAYYPYHFDPRVWSPGQIGRFLVALSSGAAAFWLTRARFARGPLVAASWMALVAGYLAISFLSVTVLPIPGLVAIHPARAVDVFACLFVVCALALLIEEAEDASGARVWVAGALVGLLFGPWYMGLQAVAQVIAWALLVPLVVQRKSARVAFAAPLGLVGLFAAFSVITRAHAGPSLLMDEPPLEVREAARDAAQRSPSDAVFLVPPEWGSFRAMSERAAFVTWQEGAAMLWQQSYAETWIARLAALGYDLRTESARVDDARPGVTRAYATLDDARVCGIARAYRIDYWIAPKNEPTCLPVAWSTGDRVVLTLKDGCVAPPAACTPTLPR